MNVHKRRFTSRSRSSYRDEYCERIYDDGKEIRDNEFSYNVVQDRGVTIVTIRGTNNGRNALTDLGFPRPFQDRKLSTNLIEDLGSRLKK